MTSFAALLSRPLILALLTLTLFSGCASVNNPRDPLEPLNRAIYQVNDGLDKVVMKPIATVYSTVLPQIVRTGVTNFFNNIYDILTALNNLLQGKLADAASDVGRIAVNTTVGVLGLIDVGTELGLEKHREDFGQTLGRWGLGSGAYLQLPFVGPSSVRDGVGLFADSKIDPIRKWLWRDHIPSRNSVLALYYINLRANLLDSTKILDEAALDPYEFQRDAYLQRRRNLVYDGNPPPEKDNEEIPELKTKPRSESDEPAGGPRAENSAAPQAAAPASDATQVTAEPQASTTTGVAPAPAI